jgi:hypothetical protein
LQALCKINTKVIEPILYARKGEPHLACDRVPIADKPIIRDGFPAAPERMHSFTQFGVHEIERKKNLGLNTSSEIVSERRHVVVRADTEQRFPEAL